MAKNVQEALMIENRFGQITSASEHLLVAIARAGEHSAFVELCRRQRAMMLRYARRITGNVEDAEDALQDAWMRAYTHLKSFDGRSAFASWVTRIVNNSALIILRKRRQRRELSLDEPLYVDAAQTLEVVERSPNPEERYGAIEMEEILQRAICRLSPTLRGAIEIRRAFDGPIDVLAAMADVSVPTMKSRLHRARMRLRERLLESLSTSSRTKKARRHQSLEDSKGTRPRRNSLQKASEEEVAATGYQPDDPDLLAFSPNRDIDHSCLGGRMAVETIQRAGDLHGG
jgi:RNA polymerase sigma-70 factor (ECF subfamily)